MTYTGVVRCGVIELENEPVLPDGTRVQVVPRPAEEELTPEGYRKGSPAAILAALDTLPALCTPEDVDALMESIKACRQPPDYRGVFDDLVDDE